MSALGFKRGTQTEQDKGQLRPEWRSGTRRLLRLDLGKCGERGERNWWVACSASSRIQSITRQSRTGPGQGIRGRLILLNTLPIRPSQPTLLSDEEPPESPPDLCTSWEAAQRTEVDVISRERGRDAFPQREFRRDSRFEHHRAVAGTQGNPPLWDVAGRR